MAEGVGTVIERTNCLEIVEGLVVRATFCPTVEDGTGNLTMDFTVSESGQDKVAMIKQG